MGKVLCHRLEMVGEGRCCHRLGLVGEGGLGVVS